MQSWLVWNLARRAANSRGPPDSASCYVSFQSRVCITTAGARGTRRGHRKPGTGVKGGCGCWELNYGPLNEQRMFLAAEPPLQPHKVVLGCSQMDSLNNSYLAFTRNVKLL